MSNKVPQQINDFVGDNVRKLGQIFPSAVKDGEVDFEALKEELGQFTEVESEKYEFTWAGKKNAKRTAQEDVVGKTLKFIPEDSKNADTTKNLYIEGDNLEVMKLIRQNYYGAIKMIYIDPPYNTGNDFVYRDNFVMEKQESDFGEGITNDLGEKYSINHFSHNRYHARWLSMMYSRLLIARNFLTDDGMIFISIDENEIDNLLKLGKEVFGEGNFINLITLKTKVGGVSGSSEGKSLKDATEFICIFAKDKSVIEMKPVYIKTKLFDKIKNYEIEGKSWKYTSIVTKLENKVLLKNDEKKKIKYYGYKTLETMSINAFAEKEGITIEDVYNKYADKIFQTTNAQSSVRQMVLRETSEFTYPMIGCEYVPIKGKNQGKEIEILYKGEQRRMMMWLSDAVEMVNGCYYYLDKVSSLWDDIQYNNLTKEGDIEFLNGKKPIKMLQRIIELSTEKDSNIMDFFSGSASTAHAVFAQNIEDGGTRKSILIQIPEKIEKKEFTNICELGKERIRRAGEKIKQENPDKDVDIGFKVFKVSDTNIKWNSFIDSGQIDITQMETSPDTIDFIPNAKDVDIVYELMLRQKNVPLSSKIEYIFAGGGYNRTYLYADSFLVCLETKITEELINKLAGIDPLPIKFIFRDSAFQDNIALKDETFRRLKALINKNNGMNKMAYTVEFI